MPTPARKKTTTKKSPALSAAPGRTKKAPAKAWHEKHYFMDEQKVFLKKYPAAEKWLMFVCAVVVLFLIVYYFQNMV